MAQHADCTVVKGTNGRLGFTFKGETQAGREVEVWVPVETIKQLGDLLKITDSPGHAGWHLYNPDTPANPSTCSGCGGGFTSKHLPNRIIKKTTYAAGDETGPISEYKPLAEVQPEAIDLFHYFHSPDFIKAEVQCEEGSVKWEAQDHLILSDEVYPYESEQLPEPGDLPDVCDTCHGKGCWECEPSEGFWER